MRGGAMVDDGDMSCCGNCCFSFGYQSRNRMLIECRRFPPTLCHYDADTDTSSWESAACRNTTTAVSGDGRRSYDRVDR